MPADELIPGRGLLLKREDVGPTGSFKWRGALCACEVHRRGDTRGVVTASTGNHGAAVAWAATRLGMAADVVVPADAAVTKCAKIEACGGRLHRVGANLEQSSAAAAALASETGRPLFVDGGSPAQLLGTGTIAAELRDVELDTLVVPLACGALAGGVAAALAGRQPAVRVVGVQSAAFSRLSAVFHGRDDPGPGGGSTLADGLADDRLVEPAMSSCLRHLDDVLTVDDGELEAAIATLHGRFGILVEGAAAAPLAALRRRVASVEGRRVVAVLSGANIDRSLAERIVGSGGAQGD